MSSDMKAEICCWILLSGKNRTPCHLSTLERFQRPNSVISECYSCYLKLSWFIIHLRFNEFALGVMWALCKFSEGKDKDWFSHNLMSFIIPVLVMKEIDKHAFILVFTSIIDIFVRLDRPFLWVSSRHFTKSLGGESRISLIEHKDENIGHLVRN